MAQPTRLEKIGLYAYMGMKLQIDLHNFSLVIMAITAKQISYYVSLYTPCLKKTVPVLFCE